jgi:hypothetical protein
MCKFTVIPLVVWKSQNVHFFCLWFQILNVSSLARRHTSHIQVISSKACHSISWATIITTFRTATFETLYGSNMKLHVRWISWIMWYWISTEVFRVCHQYKIKSLLHRLLIFHHCLCEGFKQNTRRKERVQLRDGCNQYYSGLVAKSVRYVGTHTRLWTW